jgi:hypothetical protein
MTRILLTSLLALSIVLSASPASAATGTITAGIQTNNTPYMDFDNNTVPDRINWRTSNGTAVAVTDTELTGEIWGEGLGWIKLDPLGGGVTNDGAGNLAGYAWGHNAGWISFNCSNGSNCASNGNFAVTIDPVTGNFSGDAWSENFGWLHFACPGADTCVNTDWTLEEPPAGGGGGGGGGYADCNDGMDNDGDGAVDYPADSGCTSPNDRSEADAISGYACSDGIDNDGDGAKDYPADAGCASANDTSEVNIFFDPYPGVPVSDSPTLDGAPLPESGDITFDALTSDQSILFDPVQNTTVRIIDENGRSIERQMNAIYYIPAGYDTTLKITSKRPARRVYSYTVNVGAVADEREVINESVNIIQRAIRMFFVQFAQANAISEKYFYEMISPTVFTLAYKTPATPGLYEHYTVIEYEDSKQEVIRRDMVVVEFNGDVFKSNLLSGKWSAIPSTVGLLKKSTTTGQFYTYALADNKANPVQTGPDGKYAFIVSPGEYKIQSSKEKYYPFESESFIADRNGEIVNYRVELVCKFFGSFGCGWEIKVLVILIIVGYIEHRRRKYKQEQERKNKMKKLQSQTPAQ